jgi:hypothetical protein
MEFLAHLRKSRREALRQRAQILLASMVYTPLYKDRADPAALQHVVRARALAAESRHS